LKKSFFDMKNDIDIYEIVVLMRKFLVENSWNKKNY